MRALVGLCLTVIVATSPSMSAQTDVDQAMKFFLAGGAYCFRVAPEGVTLSEQTEWTVMVLTGAQHPGDTFKIRSIDAGTTRLSGKGLAMAGEVVTNVWRLDRYRQEFFERFAVGIEGKMLQARIVKVVPPGLAQMTPSARAELYLKFADRGSKVSFEDAENLTAAEFLQYVAYFTD